MFFCFVFLVFMFVNFRVFYIVMSKRSDESEGELCEKTNKVVVAVNEVMKHSFGQTFFLVFVIISFCMGVYLTQGEKDNSVYHGYEEEKVFVNEIASRISKSVKKNCKR